MKSIRSLLLIGLLQVVTATAAFAADGLAQVKSAGVLKIGTEGTYAPFSFHDASGQLTGFDVEIGRAIAQRLGVKPEINAICTIMIAIVAVGVSAAAWVSKRNDTLRAHLAGGAEVDPR